MSELVAPVLREDNRVRVGLVSCEVRGTVIKSIEPSGLIVVMIGPSCESVRVRQIRAS